jgi:hypothetical protein
MAILFELAQGARRKTEEKVILTQISANRVVPSSVCCQREFACESHPKCPDPLTAKVFQCPPVRTRRFSGSWRGITYQYQWSSQDRGRYVLLRLDQREINTSNEDFVSLIFARPENIRWSVYASG